MASRLPTFARDPLLAAAKGVLWFLMASMAIAVLACLIALPLLLIFHDEAAGQIASQAPGLATTQFFWGIGAVLVFAALLCAVLLRMFQLLKHIVDTVGHGDPFVPENARRLTQMAWLSLAVQVITIPIGAIAEWIERLADHAELHGEHHRIVIENGVSGNGLLLMLILFILARVFRKGAEMRAELEGTV